MSATETQHNQQTKIVQTAQTPGDERLHRLAVEASKYLGLNLGEPLPIAELLAQANANGCDESDIRGWLEAKELDGRSKIPVPPQGDVLGEPW